MVFYDSSLQDYADTIRSKGAYILLYQGEPIDHCTHVPGPVAQYSTKIEHSASCNQVMVLTHFRMLNNELINIDPGVFPEQAPLIILDKKSDICMDKNGKDTKHTSHISRRYFFK